MTPAKRRWLRRHPRPEQPPEGTITRQHPERPNEVMFIPNEVIEEVCQARIVDYDNLPRQLRDIIKELG